MGGFTNPNQNGIPLALTTTAPRQLPADLQHRDGCGPGLPPGPSAGPGTEDSLRRVPMVMAQRVSAPILGTSSWGWFRGKPGPFPVEPPFSAVNSSISGLGKSFRDWSRAFCPGKAALWTRRFNVNMKAENILSCFSTWDSDHRLVAIQRETHRNPLPF